MEPFLTCSTLRTLVTFTTHLTVEAEWADEGGCGLFNLGTEPVIRLTTQHTINNLFMSQTTTFDAESVIKRSIGIYGIAVVCGCVWPAELNEMFRIIFEFE
jgi:hypothetical protein